MSDSQNKKTEVEVRRLSNILKKESSDSIDIVEDVMKNLNKDNIISFLDTMLYEDGNGWKKNNKTEILDKLCNIGIIKNKNLQKILSSEMTTFLVMSQLERIAENLNKFTQNVLRTVWMTEDDICSSCGSEQTSDSLYCNQCGTEMTNNSWDSSIRRATTEIGKSLMTKIKHRYYYIDSINGIKCGTFYKSNLEDADIDYLIESLKKLKINVTDANDRIYFEIINEFQEDDKVMTHIAKLAKQLQFQEGKHST